MTPADLYRTCRVSAFRLETLQHYEVSDDAERQRAFLGGHPLPPPRPAKIDDLQLIAELQKAGRRLGRVHVVDRPLSEYVRYELAAYEENVAAGEEVRIADRSLHPELADLDRDFVIYDGETAEASVILFNYDADGRLLKYEHTSDPATVQRCRRQLELTYASSVPLDVFVAASP